jgi:hypothetical protein
VTRSGQHVPAKSPAHSDAGRNRNTRVTSLPRVPFPYRRRGTGLYAALDPLNAFYPVLPAHYPTLDEALDRVAYPKGKGFKARALALVATPTDTAAEFESAKIQPPE